MIGRTIGPYRVTAKLGEGGMGAVYRAHDTKLARDVALKILPEAFAGDPDRLARFEREARTLASLNHPNIAQIYGIEESTSPGQPRVRALVIELVPGRTLAELNNLSIAETLAIAHQIASAVEVAHAHGVIHRDLKPANVKVRDDGVVKVLDFGLAKTMESAPDQAMTVTSPVVTGHGVILGTAAYMAPEQATGKPVDERADVWAFGCVMYELLTGRRAFDGPNVTEVLTAVLRDTPSLEHLPRDTPSSIRRLLRRSFEKNPSQRLDSMAVARLEIDDALSGSPETAATNAAGGTSPGPSRRAPLLLAGAALGALITALIATLWIVRADRSSGVIGALPVSATIALSPEMALSFGKERPALVVAPDGRTIAFSGGPDGKEAIYLRPLDRFETTKVAGTDGGTGPFFSPDGRWIAFHNAGKLWKVPTGGGVALAICDAALPRGAAWLPDDTIIFSPDPASGLVRVAAAGGVPQALTMLDPARHEKTHRSPVLLPGGQSIVFAAGSDEIATYDEARLVGRRLDSGEQKDILTGGYSPVYSPTGHLLYAHNGAVFAVSFDPVAMAVRGTPVQVVQNVATAPNYGSAEFDVSRDGTLVYAMGGARPAGGALAWKDRQGRAERIRAPEREYLLGDFSPDGRRLLATIVGANNVAWAYDVERGSMSRLTFRGDVTGAIWNPNGADVTYLVGLSIRRIAADGSGREEILIPQLDRPAVPMSWSPDGQTLALALFTADNGADIAIFSVADKRITPLMATRFNEFYAQFSPNGRWLAYTSDESGLEEVYVREVTGASVKQMVSTGGGSAPMWSRDGRELIYGSRAGLMSVAIRETPVFATGRPTTIFSGDHQVAMGKSTTRTSLAPDGRRFVVVESQPPESLTAIRVVLNWFDELKARVK